MCTQSEQGGRRQSAGPVLAAPPIQLRTKHMGGGLLCDIVMRTCMIDRASTIYDHNALISMGCGTDVAVTR